MNIQEITSNVNPKIKEVVALLEKSKQRRKASLFVVEGLREIQSCINHNYKIKSIFFNQEIVSLSQLEDMNLPDDVKLMSVSANVYSKIAYRETTEGIVAVVEEKRLELKDIEFGRKWEKPFVLVLESVEKPGNLGALLRTADACGVDAVLVCDPLTDLYNPNLIRSSLGGIFTNQVVACTNQQALEWLREHNINIYTAQLQDSKWYYQTDMTSATAIVMGTESTGLTDFWRNESNGKIKIPMLGEMDSLNVSVSAAVLCYEAVRQRSNQ